VISRATAERDGQVSPRYCTPPSSTITSWTTPCHSRRSRVPGLIRGGEGSPCREVRRGPVQAAARRPVESAQGFLLQAVGQGSEQQLTAHARGPGRSVELLPALPELSLGEILKSGKIRIERRACAFSGCDGCSPSLGRGSCLAPHATPRRPGGDPAGSPETSGGPGEHPMDALWGRRVKPVERRFLGPSGAHSPPIRDHGRGGGGQDPRLGPRPVAIGGFRPAQEGSVKMGAAPTSRSLSVLKARPRVRSAHWGESSPAPESAAFAARRTPRAGATNPREIRAERGTSGSSQPQNVRSWLSS